MTTKLRLRAYKEFMTQTNSAVYLNTAIKQPDKCKREPKSVCITYFKVYNIPFKYHKYMNSTGR